MADEAPPAREDDPAEQPASERRERRAGQHPHGRRRRNVLVGVAVIVVVVVGLTWIAKRKRAMTATSLEGLSVAFDRGHGDGWQDGAKSLEARGAKARVVESALTEKALAGVDVLVLMLPRRTPFTAAELDTLERLVDGGMGLVVAEHGRSWTAYDGQPVEELPANTLGRRLAFAFTSETIGTEGNLDTSVVAGPSRLARKDWVPSRIAVSGTPARVVVRDGQMRPMAGTTEHGRGRIAVFGHPEMLLENPPLFLWAVSFAGRRAAP